MPDLRRRLLPALAASTTILALTSCSNDDGAPECVDGVVELGTGREVELDVDCTLVRINGTDTTADLSSADVEQIEINGDRNTVTADGAPSVRISGQENEIMGADLGAVDIHGDRNTVSAEGEVGSIAVHGNDNAATAATFGDVTDGGDRNGFTESS